jgi:hypothetical protein
MNMATLANTATQVVSILIDDTEVYRLAGTDPAARLLVAQSIFDQTLIVLASPMLAHLDFPPTITKAMITMGELLAVTPFTEPPATPPSQQSIDKTIAQLQREGRVVVPSLWQI